MSSPTIFDCRGMQLLKLGDTPEGESYVSVHQLSLYLWELFKVPRGSVQKKIGDLGLNIYACSKEGVQILRDQSVISAYKASQITLNDAEKVFDAIQLSRQKREINERKKQEHADKKWLQRVGNKRPDVLGDANEDSGQEEKGVEQQNEVEKCALYRVSSPPTRSVALGSKVKGPSMSEDNRVGLECKDGMAKGNEVVKRNTIVLKRTTTANGHSKWVGKKATINGIKKHKKHKIERHETQDIENSVHHKKAKRSGSTSEQQVLVPSLLPNGNEESSVLDSSSLDVFQGSISDEEKDGNLYKQEVTSDLDSDDDSHLLEVRDAKDKFSSTLNNKRIVKLRVFAQNSSPKVKSTFSKPPCPSIGKRFPSTSEKTPKVSRKPLVVSIPRSLLTEQCNKDFSSAKCFSCEQAPSTTTLVCSPSARAGQKRLRNFKGKVKETALCTFASKKRASTRTPPPLESLVAKHPRLRPGSSSVSPISPPVSPFLVQSGAEVNILSKYLFSRPCRSRKSTLSSSSCSPQPGSSLSSLKCQPIRSICNDPGSPDFLPDTNNGSKLESSKDDSLGAPALLPEGRNPSSTKQSQVLPRGFKSEVPSNSDKEENSFNFRKFFDSVPCKLVVCDGELCPATSLSLKGVKTSDVPPDHPIWTWRVGQPTDKAAPVGKWRATRQKNTKSKIQSIS